MWGLEGRRTWLRGQARQNQIELDSLILCLNCKTYPSFWIAFEQYCFQSAEVFLGTQIASQLSSQGGNVTYCWRKNLNFLSVCACKPTAEIVPAGKILFGESKSALFLVWVCYFSLRLALQVQGHVASHYTSNVYLCLKSSVKNWFEKGLGSAYFFSWQKLHYSKPIYAKSFAAEVSLF